jgi:hypothetical protein
MSICRTSEYYLPIKFARPEEHSAAATKKIPNASIQKERKEGGQLRRWVTHGGGARGPATRTRSRPATGAPLPACGQDVSAAGRTRRFRPWWWWWWWGDHRVGARNLLAGSVGWLRFVPGRGQPAAPESAAFRGGKGCGAPAVPSHIRSPHEVSMLSVY